jgi:hypothetical protein
MGMFPINGRRRPAASAVEPPSSRRRAAAKWTLAPAGGYRSLKPDQAAKEDR